MELELPEDARALLDAVVAIGSDLDLHGVLGRIVESACALTHAEAGILAMLDDEGEFVDLVMRGVSDDMRERIGMMPTGRGLLGLVPGQRSSVRVGRVEEHPAFEGFPPGHPVIDQFLGAPVLAGDRAVGHLYLGHIPGGREFTDTDQAIVEALGRAAGAMIDNARAFEESERNRAWMEGVARVATALAPSLHDDRSLNAMVEQVCELSRARFVALLDVGSARLEVTACAGGGAEDATLIVKSSAEGIARAAADGEIINIRDAADHATLVVPIRTELAAPAVLLIDQSTAWGSLGLDEHGLLAALANHVGLTLDRAQALRERHEQLLAKDRDRIARDLHDLVIQRLFATGLQLQGARSLNLPDGLRARIDGAITDLDVAIADLRATIFELGRGAGRSLHEEVRALVGEYQAVLGFLPTLRVSGQVDRSLTEDAADGLLLTLRELLSNIARHAQASSTVVELSASPRWVTMCVADDGVGFDPSAGGRRSGLANVQHRAEALGGRLTVDSAAGTGCRFEWAVPAIR